MAHYDGTTDYVTQDSSQAKKSKVMDTLERTVSDFLILKDELHKLADYLVGGGDSIAGTGSQLPVSSSFLHRLQDADLTLSDVRTTMFADLQRIHSKL